MSGDKRFEKYLRLVEQLFRAGKIKLILATRSLAYGVNLPAKTCVFWGYNSRWLTPALVQQCGKEPWSYYSDIASP